MTFKPPAAVIALGVALAGCASHNWAPGPQAAGDLAIVSGQCKLEAAKTPIPTSTHLLSDQNGGYFVTSGVGLSGIIASSIQKQDIYNACMEANGFVVADGARPITGYNPSPAPTGDHPSFPEPYSGHSSDNVAEINVYGATVYGHSGRLICECPKPTLKADGTWLGCPDLSPELNSTITGLNAKALPQMPLERYEKQLQQLITAIGFGPCWGA